MALINYNNIQSFSSADYAFLFSFAQKLKETENKNISFGLNAKIIHRSVGKFAKAWGFGLDGGYRSKLINGDLVLRGEILQPHLTPGHLILPIKKSKPYTLQIMIFR